jgi:hypothetical protein
MADPKFWIPQLKWRSVIVFAVAAFVVSEYFDFDGRLVEF